MIHIYIVPIYKCKSCINIALNKPFRTFLFNTVVIKIFYEILLTFFGAVLKLFYFTTHRPTSKELVDIKTKHKKLIDRPMRASDQSR